MPSRKILCCRFSHDEVVHGKASLLNKMPGDLWQQFANLRLLYGYMFAHPGKKLMFMGGEFGQREEWDHDTSLEWHLLEYAPHRGLQTLATDLNAVYRNEAALHEVDFDWHGFEWLDCNDADASVLSFLRRAKDHGNFIVVVANYTPVLREDYRVGVPEPGYLPGNYEHRRGKIWRDQRRQSRRRPCRSRSLGQPHIFHQSALASSCCRLFQARTLVAVLNMRGPMPIWAPSDNAKAIRSSRIAIYLVFAKVSSLRTRAPSI